MRLVLLAVLAAFSLSACVDAADVPVPDPSMWPGAVRDCAASDQACIDAWVAQNLTTHR
jgi:hypothetical protein